MERIRRFLESVTDVFGVCAFADVPLLPVRSRQRLPENACSIIVLLFGYYTEEYPERNLARYAIADDYHAVLLPKLQRLAAQLSSAFPEEAFVPFIDASPVMETQAARQAGLGQIGKNGQLLNPQYGSYCFIGEVVTTLHLAAPLTAQAAICNGCGACVAACPSGALTADGFYVEKCRSYLTQKKGELAVWERHEIARGKMAWGCDCCVDACPINRKAQKSRVPEFYQNRVPILTCENVAALCTVKAYGWRGQSILYRNLSFLEKLENDADEC